MVKSVSFNGTNKELANAILLMVNARKHLWNYYVQTELQKPDRVSGTHLKHLCDIIEKFLQSDKRILCVTCPPRHSKSTIFSEILPCWFVNNDRQREVIITSFSQTQSRKMLRACRQRFDDPFARRIWKEPVFVVDSADELQLDGKQNGRPNILALGAGAGLTGNGADLLIIDDIIKSMADSQSPTIMGTLWDWFQSAVLTRLSPNGKCVCVFTRWATDDIIGRTLSEFPADMVEYHNFPAISPDGKPLWKQRYPLERLEEIRRSVSSRVFQALYQGNPTTLEGNIIHRDWFAYSQRASTNATRVRAWDLASTEGAGDWTAGVLMAYEDGKFVVEDVVHVQWSASKVFDLIRDTADRDGQEVSIVIEEQGGAAGKMLATTISRMLARYALTYVKPTGSKLTRATPFIASMERGDLVWVRQPQISEDVEFEFTQFDGTPSTTSRHDDIVDATALAYNRLAEWTEDAGSMSFF